MTKTEDGFFILTKDQFVNQKFPDELCAGDDVHIMLDNGYYWDILPVHVSDFCRPDGTIILSVFGDEVCDPIFGSKFIDMHTDWLTPLENRYFAHQEEYDAALANMNSRSTADKIPEENNHGDDSNAAADTYDDAANYF